MSNQLLTIARQFATDHNISQTDVLDLASRIIDAVIDDTHPIVDISPRDDDLDNDDNNLLIINKITGTYLDW